MAGFGSWGGVTGVKAHRPTAMFGPATDGIHWEERSSEAAWPGRIWATAASYDGLLWIMGGFINKTRSCTNDIWYSTDGSDWYPYLASKVWSPRSAHSTVEFNGQLWVLAGSNGDYFNDVWVLKADGNDLRQGSAMVRAVKWLYKAFTPLEGGSPCARGSVPRSAKLVGDLNIERLGVTWLQQYSNRAGGRG